MDPTQSCGADNIFIEEAHSLKFRVGMGQGTKLMGLELLLTLAGDQMKWGGGEVSVILFTAAFI